MGLRGLELAQYSAVANYQAGVMATEARASFEENWQTIRELVPKRGERGKGSHAMRAARNKAALVFCITAWEAYVEDLVREGTDYLALNCNSFSDLPRDVRKTLERAVTPLANQGGRTPSGRRPADLADDGWRRVLPELAIVATEGSGFNTPNSKHVAELFTKWCGVDVTAHWSWQRFPKPSAAERLDESIGLRGDIVHRGRKPEGLNKFWIETYGEHNIRRLVERTDAALIAHINSVCNGEMTGSPAFGEA
jgi:hypothetical protein